MRVSLLIAPLLLLGTAAPAADAESPWLEARVLNIDHQGGEDEFPSNTLYAFKRWSRPARTCSSSTA
jgi:glycerophosphoryl diester phosphodiesterase